MECYKCTALLASLSSLSIYGGPCYFFACINQKVTAENKLTLYLSKMNREWSLLGGRQWQRPRKTPENWLPVHFLQCGELFPHWKGRNGIVDMELKHMTGESVITRQLAPSMNPSFYIYVSSSSW